MTSLALAPSPAGLGAEALVIGVAQDPTGPRLVADGLLGDEVAARLTPLLGRLGISGSPEEARVIPVPDAPTPLLVLSGLGVERPSGWTPEALRRAAGAALAVLDGVGRVAVALPANSAEEVAAVGEGALLGAYRFSRYRSTGTTAPPESIHVVTGLSGEQAVRGAVERAQVLARAVNAARDLVNTSPRDLPPATFADLAVAAAKGTPVKVTVLDEAELLAGGYGGLIGVGQGSSRPPRLVKLSYAPARAGRHVALVGKGITFDSGGLSIKSAKAMETMKLDMAGAAAVLHVVLAAAELALPVRVTGWLALAENLPSGTAQRPSDVITIRGGTTVEVLNTDAEGRLVLADALAEAVVEGPDLVLDIATLTGAQMIALGTRVAAVMGDDAPRTAVLAAAERSGESFWPMPLPPELDASLKSQVADLANIGDRYGGMLVAGLFLRHFVGTTPWAHLDIAGPSFNEGEPRGYLPKGGTGVGVRTLLTLLEHQAGS